MEKYAAVIDYASEEVGTSDLDGVKGMNGSQIDELIQEVAKKCLEIGCKVGLFSLVDLCHVPHHGSRASF